MEKPEPTITCPRCGAPIRVTESLAAPLVESARRELEAEFTRKSADLSEREKSLAELKVNLQRDTEESLSRERVKIAAEESRRARLALGADLELKAKEVAELNEILEQKNSKLLEAQAAQAELARKGRELEDAKRELDLTVEQRVQNELESVRQVAASEAEQRYLRQVEERDRAVASMKELIETKQLRDIDLSKREGELSRQKESLESELGERLRVERAKIVAEEARKAKSASQVDLDQRAAEVTELRDLVAKKDARLAESQKAEAELLRKSRELDDTRREIDLTVERRVQDGLSSVREQARKETEEQLKLKLMEKELTISGMQKQIEELGRKAEQGSQQLQGEVQELDLEAVFKSQFLHDAFEPVPKGEHGGDLLHRVHRPTGQLCGTILWEFKRTKNWSDGWLPKLRDDQRSAKADAAVVISQALPKGVESFDLIDGVWVAHPRVALPMAVLIRHTLIEVATSRQAVEGQQTKMEMVYQYLTGPRFRQRLQAIVEGFSSMKEDLEKERKVIQKQWSKRSEQIERVLTASVGMYGDLQGIAGKTLQEIEGLEMRALEGPKPEDGAIPPA